MSTCNEGEGGREGLVKAGTALYSSSDGGVHLEATAILHQRPAHARARRLRLDDVLDDIVHVGPDLRVVMVGVVVVRVLWELALLVRLHHLLLELVKIFARDAPELRTNEVMGELPCYELLKRRSIGGRLGPALLCNDSKASVGLVRYGRALTVVADFEHDGCVRHVSPRPIRRQELPHDNGEGVHVARPGELVVEALGPLVRLCARVPRSCSLRIHLGHVGARC